MVAHTGIIQFPLRKGWKRVHRLVVLPDFQGVGIGTTFINNVARITNKRGYNLNLTTTTPALVHALKRDKCWKLIRYGRIKGSIGKSCMKQYGTLGHLDTCKSENRVTYSFNFEDNGY